VSLGLESTIAEIQVKKRRNYINYRLNPYSNQHHTCLDFQVSARNFLGGLPNIKYFYPYPADTFVSYRVRLLKLTCYIARPFLLAYTTWVYGARRSFDLTDRPSMKACHLVVVGRVSDDQTLLDPLSIIKSSPENAPITDLNLVICIRESDVLTDFQTDFHTGWNNLHTLLCNPAIQSDYSASPKLFRRQRVLLEPNKIIFMVPLLQRKVSH